MRGIRRRLVIGIGLLGISLLSGIGGESVRADDLADIQQAFEADIRLFNGQDPTAFTATAHEHVVLFGPLSPFAVEGKAAIQQLVQEYFTNHDYVKWLSVNAKFLVIETSGLAWGHYTVREQPRVGPRRILHGRYTFTYAKEENTWLVVALDFSPL